MNDSALLVMDFQDGIVETISDPEPLLARAEQAIAWARGHDVQVGYVRVAFTDADLESFPATSRMGERRPGSRNARVRDDEGSSRAKRDVITVAELEQLASD